MSYEIGIIQAFKEMQNEMKSLKDIVAKPLRQFLYELRCVRCETTIFQQQRGSDGSIVSIAHDAPDGTFYLTVPKPFLHLDAFEVDNSDEKDSEFDAGINLENNKFNNMLTRIQDHPAAYFAQYCEMRSFFTAPGTLLVPDIRENKNDLVLQYAVILQSIDY